MDEKVVARHLDLHRVDQILEDECPLCHEVVRLIPMRRPGLYRMTQLDSYHSHVEVCLLWEAYRRQRSLDLARYHPGSTALRAVDLPSHSALYAAPSG